MVIIDLPLDENEHSLIAHDFSGFQDDAQVVNTLFKPGHVGYSLDFKGDGYAKTGNTNLDLSGDFTVTSYIKQVVNPPYSVPSQLSFQLAFSNLSIWTFEIPVILDIWQRVMMVKDGDYIKIYADTSLVHSEDISALGVLTEWAIKQLYSNGQALNYTFPVSFGSNGANYFQGFVDQVLIFNEALTPDQLNILTAKSELVLWEIDAIPFLNYDVYVSQSSGLIDALETKEGVSIDWPNEHGIIIDLKRIKFKPRTIKLKCWIKVDAGYIEFVQKANEFISNFIPPGLHRLKAGIDEYKSLEYEIYMAAGTEINKKWNAKDFVGTFELDLIEPQPIKRVVRFNSSHGAAKIKITGLGLYNIFWGDGLSSLDNDCSSGLIIQHDYQTTDIFYAVITGNIDEITDFLTNGITTWTRL